MNENAVVYMYSVTLSDGTVIDELNMNGNTLVSLTEITEDMFEGKLNHVIVDCIAYDSDGNAVKDAEIMMPIPYQHDMYNVELLTVQENEWEEGKTEWWFAFREIPAERLKEMKLNEQIADLQELQMDLAYEQTLLELGVIE